MTRVKICGIRTIEHAQAVADAGADMIGLVFAPSKRRIEPEQAAEIAASLRATRPNRMPILVGLFVNETPERIATTAERCGLDGIQLSGDETVDIVDALPELPVLKAVRLAGDTREVGWLASALDRVTLLVDAHVPGSYGGTGSVADWDKARLLAGERAILLAGGLTPDNVAAAIAQVRPWGVDVSSGVETHGQKDSAKIQRFVALVRAAGELTTR